MAKENAGSDPSKFHIVAFDLDGTLVNEKSSWLKIHDYFGTVEKAAPNLAAYIDGHIDYEEFMRRDISLWPRRLHISQIKRILSSFTLIPDANEVVHQLKQRGHKVVIISAGLDLLCDQVASLLGVDGAVANGLQTDRDGFLTGSGVLRVDLNRKDEALNVLLDKMHLSKRDCVCVGDSRYDVRFLENAGLSVAINSDEALAKVARVRIHQLSELLAFV